MRERLVREKCPERDIQRETTRVETARESENKMQRERQADLQIKIVIQREGARKNLTMCIAVNPTHIKYERRK